MAAKFQRSLLMVFLVGLWFATAQLTRAQSDDQNLPTPVLSHEIKGTILALDLGDPRLTRHFYAFEGTPGDLIITVNSKNLNGDVDVFTAITFRPLVKTAMYANTLSPEVSKSLYLRSRQILILRVEARTPNDDPGTYHIRFGGSFAPFSGGIPVAENQESSNEEARPGGRNTQRLSSVGARINEPAAEPVPIPAEVKETPADKPAEDTTTARKATTRSTRPKPTRPAPRSARGRTPTPAKPNPAETDQPKAESGEARKEVSSPGAEKSESGEKSSPKTATQDTAVPPGPHLIIETKEGTRIDRPMSTVRRVVVEGGMILIVLKTGRMERIALSAVARMAIEP